MTTLYEYAARYIRISKLTMDEVRERANDVAPGCPRRDLTMASIKAIKAEADAASAIIAALVGPPTMDRKTIQYVQRLALDVAINVCEASDRAGGDAAECVRRIRDLRESPHLGERKD